MSLLDPLRLPLEFALKPGAVARVRGLEDTLKKAAQRVEDRLPAKAREQLSSVVSGLTGFDALEESARLAAVQRAHMALTALMRSLSSEPPPAAQPTSSAPPDPTPPAASLGPPAPKSGAAVARVATTAVDPVPPPKARSPRASKAPEVPQDILAAPVNTLSGVGPKLSEALQERGLETLADLLRTLPKAYEDRTSIRPIATLEVGERALIQGDIQLSGPSGFGSQRRWEVLISDGTGRIRLTWFRFNGQQMQKRFPPGGRLMAAGPVSRFGQNKQMVHAEVDLVSDAEAKPAGVMPVYGDVEGIPRPRLRKLILQALERVEGRVPEVLPPEVLAEQQLPTMEQAMRDIHAPPPDADVALLNDKNTPAHKRMAFEEFFIMQVALAQRRRGQATRPAMPVDPGMTPEQLIARLFPFPPTGAQARVVTEIARDMARSEPMARLLQGDVGSGKTAVAAAACLMAVQAGAQAALVAPTEILAEQHYRNLTRMLAPLRIATDLITGSLTGRERVGANARLQQGVTQVVVGTHALLMEGMNFRRLALACIDEQHRFGVEQRKALMEKGPLIQGVSAVPHLLVMTATPIPRTLALTLYGDLDVSVLNEMPPGRKPVTTRVVTTRTRQKAVDAVTRALAAGRQVYVVFPLVEESENSDLLDATQGAEEMRALFPQTRVELLHGRMTSDEKDHAMQRFIRKEAGILVSTTVIEVGVDVPNATVMWIEHAERFGLSQLHQLRGRVGRGADGSECYLMARGKGSEDAQRRLQIMAETQDGFRVAEEDLAIRGPGDFFGTRQSGAPPFMYANLLRHGALMEQARTHAWELLKKDPDLQQPAHGPLRVALAQRYQARLELARAG